jgi:hypothetical protein
MWEDNIKIDLKEIGYDSVNWIRLAQDKAQCRTLVYTVIHLTFQVLTASMKMAVSWDFHYQDDDSSP